jgi:hypothetical protein
LSFELRAVTRGAVLCVKIGTEGDVSAVARIAAACEQGERDAMGKLA